MYVYILQGTLDKYILPKWHTHWVKLHTQNIEIYKEIYVILLNNDISYLYSKMFHLSSSVTQESQAAKARTAHKENIGNLGSKVWR